MLSFVTFHWILVGKLAGRYIVVLRRMNNKFLVNIADNFNGQAPAQQYTINATRTRNKV